MTLRFPQPDVNATLLVSHPVLTLSSRPVKRNADDDYCVARGNAGSLHVRLTPKGVLFELQPNAVMLSAGFEEVSEKAKMQLYGFEARTGSEDRGSGRNEYRMTSRVQSRIGCTGPDHAALVGSWGHRRIGSSPGVARGPAIATSLKLRAAR